MQPGLGRLLSPAGFGLVLLFFLLPFVSVSCEPVSSPVQATFTGVDLVVGGSPEVTGLRTDQEADEAERGLTAMFHDRLHLEPLALLAALAVLAGMVGATLTQRLARHVAGTGLAVLAAGLLTAAQVRVFDRLDEAIRSTVDAGEPAPGVAETRYGFWLAAALLGLLAAGHGVALVRSWRAAESPSATPPAAPDQAPAPSGPG